jgi:3-phosphoshikimate 1-carboxyvinyltransferase
VLHGRDTLARRPVDMIEAALGALGVTCSSVDGCPPLRLAGWLRPGRLTLDASVTSQLVSGLLMALPVCAADSELVLRELRSPRYAAMTVALMRRFGVHVEHDEPPERIEIRGNQHYQPADVTIEGDYSGAAFPLVAGALAGRVQVTGLEPEALQPDRAVLEALARAGAKIDVVGDTVSVERAALQAFELDATDCPDLFPPLAALACHCAGTTVLRGAGRLRHKESDRATALVEELGKMGATIELRDDQLCVTGSPLHYAQVDAHDDHRIAMACAVAALGSAGGVTIDGAACVAKSYPAFFDDLASLGAQVS